MNINSITQHILDFDINKYKFKEQIENLFRVSDLSTIHNTWKSDYELLNDHTKDQATVYHRRFYDKKLEKYSTLYFLQLDFTHALNVMVKIKQPNRFPRML